MFARLPLVFTLILSLLFTAQALPVTSRPPKRDAAGCVEMACVKGCCHINVCCGGSQQQHAPRPQVPLASRAEIQCTMLDFQGFAVLYALAAEGCGFVIVDETDGSHSLPPLAASCIRLI